MMRAPRAIDWAALRASGIGFAMLGTACVHHAPRAAAAGLAVGLVCGARERADTILSAAAPYRGAITLWAACAVESPAEAEAAEAVLARLAESGYAPMVRAESAVLRRAPELRRYPLWLCDWAIGEARALMENPRMRQWGRDPQIPAGMNVGYFS